MERALVELARGGDEEAFASLIRMAGDRLMAVAFRILRDADRAEDAVQQAIVTAWRDLPALRDPDRFGGWLYRILVNACYVEARKSRRWNANIRLLTPDIGSLVRRAAVRRGPRRAGTGLPAPADRAARRLRPASLHRDAPGRYRRGARYPGGHRQIAPPLRDGVASGGHRGRCPDVVDPTRERLA